ncbi:MAG: hypothetical protein B6A08_00555 [Sorangiineae bacterium NIC37A_2]|jgi:hypothetical protein|nr:MAG: hypothetical protein B6A08_00555 [Sorangiineae bacterium NIC37A_2]
MTAPDKPSPGQALLSFLDSVGSPTEAQMYLRLFRAVPRGRFAVVLPTDAVLRERAGTLAEQLALLHALDISVSLAVGAFDNPTEEEVGWLFDALREAELPAVRIPYSEDALEKAEEALSRSEIPVFVLRERAVGSVGLPEDAAIAPDLEELLVKLSPRKIIILRGRGGLGPHGVGRLEVAPGHVLLGHASGLSVINLRSDQAPLVRGGFLPPLDVAWLRRARSLLELLWSGSGPQTAVTIASPLSLLRELFTVRGEGTLIRLGAEVEKFSSWDEIDRNRLHSLLEASFGRELRPGFWGRTPLEIHLEKGYRGVALTEPGHRVPYLSKFAVLPEEQGEGLGQELWWHMVRRNPSLYWRSRTENRANGWYRAVCDGMQRVGDWTVFWRGVEPHLVPELIGDALARPSDFESPRVREP